MATTIHGTWGAMLKAGLPMHGTITLGSAYSGSDITLKAIDNMSKVVVQEHCIHFTCQPVCAAAPYQCKVVFTCASS